MLVVECYLWLIKFKNKVKILKLKNNLGYAGGNNEGIKLALKNKDIKYIVCLNNDTIVDENWLMELINIAESDKKIGMVGSKAYLRDGRIINTMGLKIGIAGDGDSVNKETEINKIICPCGVSILFKTEALKEIELNGEYFDNDFFCYNEDLDIGLRLIRKDWKSAYAHKSKLIHYCGGTASNDFAAYQLHRNMLWVIIKNYSLGKIILTSPFIIFYQFALLFLYMIRGKLNIIIKAKIDSIKGFSKMIYKRKIILGHDKYLDRIYKK